MNIQSNKEIARQASVMILEDDPQWQRLLSQAIRSIDSSCTIHLAESVEQLNAYAKASSSFDLIVADQRLSGDSTGLDLWREMQLANNQTPFLLISGSRLKPIASDFTDDAEFPSFISKTSDFRAIRSRLAQLVREATLSNDIQVEQGVQLTNHRAALLMAATLLVLAPQAFELAKSSSRALQLSFDKPGVTATSETPRVPALPLEQKIATSASAPSIKSATHKQFIPADVQQTVARIVKRAGSTSVE